MEGIKKKVLDLFAETGVATTDALTQALFIPNNDGRTRAIRNRLNKLGIPATMLSYQTWVLNK